ncbi:MAG: ABC transporter substrate-binding protein [Limnobacter sp.]
MRRLLAVIGVMVVLMGHAQARPLRLAVSASPLTLPIVVAHGLGYFRDEGVDVELINCPDGLRCMDLLLSGKAELATTSELPVMFNSISRKPFVVLTTFVTAQRHQRILIRAESKGVPSLAGKRIGYSPESSGHYFLDLVLLFQGLDNSDVQLVPLRPEQAYDMIRSGEIDAMALWDPYIARIHKQLGREVTELPLPNLYTTTFNLLASKTIEPGSNGAVRALLRALDRACQQIERDPDYARSLMSKRYGLSPDLVAQLFPNYRFRLSMNQSLIRTMSDQVRWAKREGVVPALAVVPDFYEVLETAPLRAVNPKAVNVSPP